MQFAPQELSLDEQVNVCARAIGSLASSPYRPNENKHQAMELVEIFGLTILKDERNWIVYPNNRYHLGHGIDNNLCRAVVACIAMLHTPK